MSKDGTMHVDHAELTQVVQNAIAPFVSRLERVEAGLVSVDARVDGFASALTACAQAAANAANAALDAKKTASDVRAEATQLIESALAIHKNSIALVVDGAIKAAIGPVLDDVEGLKKSNGPRDGAMVVVARALGVDKQLDKELVASVPAAEPGAGGGTLKSSRFVQAVIAIGLLAKVLFDILAPHH